MGSPIVFQTTPPQPASKARWAWYPVLAGGPEATQKGFGLFIPARLIDKSAIIQNSNIQHPTSREAVIFRSSHWRFMQNATGRRNFRIHAVLWNVAPGWSL